MDTLNRIGHIFYGSAIAATGLQQFFFSEFFQILFPPFNDRISGLIYFAWLTAVILVVAGVAILLDMRTRFFGMLLGCVFLAFFLIFYVPFQLFISPYSPIHLGVWINPLKEFAYAGGAFVIASQAAKFIQEKKSKSGFTRMVDRLAPHGQLLYAFTMISFGISHFYYTETVQNMVPTWIPGHLFWTYFAGIALIASGFAIVFNFKKQIISTLLGVMIFCWFVVLHIPGAIANPVENNGNEIFSAFSALAFSGIALVIGHPDRTR